MGFLDEVNLILCLALSLFYLWAFFLCFLQLIFFPSSFSELTLSSLKTYQEWSFSLSSTLSSSFASLIPSLSFYNNKPKGLLR